MNTADEYLYSAQEVSELVQSSGKTPRKFAEDIGVAPSTMYKWMEPNSGVKSKGVPKKNLAAIRNAFEQRDEGPAPLIQVDRQADRFRDDITAIMRDLTPHQLIELRDSAREMQLRTLAHKYGDRLAAMIPDDFKNMLDGADNEPTQDQPSTGTEGK